jgi:hypothetical protein
MTEYREGFTHDRFMIQTIRDLKVDRTSEANAIAKELELDLEVVHAEGCDYDLPRALDILERFSRTAAILKERICDQIRREEVNHD